jgi:FkbM family methyltransferase
MSQEEYIHLQTQSPFAVFLRKVRVALTPPGMTLTATLNGGVVVSGRNKAGWGGRGIYIFREDLEPELQLLPKLLPKGGTFIDIGANVGVYSVLAASAVGPAGRVVAVEPFPDIYAQLYRNVAANGFGATIRTRNFCISNLTGPITLWMNHGRPHSFSLNREGDAGGLSVLSIRLDDLVAWEKLDRLDYLKIDAEGAELSILEGTERTLREFRPIIQVEDVNRTIHQRLSAYRAFSVPKTRNTLMIPQERLDGLQGSVGGVWKQLDEHKPFNPV